MVHYLDVIKGGRLFKLKKFGRQKIKRTPLTVTTAHSNARSLTIWTFDSNTKQWT
jgi:hypothetical protein